MHIALVDSLRCPAAHAESWLVASCDRMEARHILEGFLGCPVCEAKYPVRDGAVWFDERELPAGRATDPAEEDAVRLAAFLDLTDARGFALLCGDWGAYAPAVSSIAPTPLLLLNPPGGVPSLPELSVIHCSTGVPISASSARAAAIDDVRPDAAVDVVVPGGRVVGPATIAPPEGVSLLARDEQLWVGERSPHVALTPLRRSRDGGRPGG